MITLNIVRVFVLCKSQNLFPSPLLAYQSFHQVSLVWSGIQNTNSRPETFSQTFLEAGDWTSTHSGSITEATQPWDWRLYQADPAAPLILFGFTSGTRSSPSSVQGRSALGSSRISSGGLINWGMNSRFQVVLLTKYTGIATLTVTMINMMVVKQWRMVNFAKKGGPWEDFGPLEMGFVLGSIHLKDVGDSIRTALEECFEEPVEVGGTGKTLRKTGEMDRNVFFSWSIIFFSECVKFSSVYPLESIFQFAGASHLQVFMESLLPAEALVKMPSFRPKIGCGPS